ncbi:hypothetical protein J5J86_08730 [Aquabacter sp. L1I39]|uniref:hypothetical protein n=1 Tax=Aquabacter sp. L1I39 TaxID=2820278 RepID=UPI001AD9B0EE|nr:hypothetical protein [Aquabacter sp. L1I39]QTL05351.1 hypothetical protein J5J86_08730 [Aquabacter sp. L1I39]
MSGGSAVEKAGAGGSDPAGPPRLSVGDIVVLAVLASARFYVEVNSRLLLIPAAGHDDGYFMRMASHIAAGQWLGPYDQYTLMKGPGYPVFVALATLFGGPISIGHALFHLLAILVGAIAVLRLTRSKAVFFGTFLLLLLIPSGFDTGVHRVIRDQIYWGQTLIIFACTALVLFAPPDGWSARLGLGLAGGATLAWALVTREEGVWFFPGLAALLLAGIVWSGISWKTARHLLPGLAGAACGFSALLLALLTANFVTYGAFVTVDFQDRAFKDVIGALSSIEDGGPVRQVPVTVTAMEKAAAVSPALARLAADLQPGGPLAKWYEASCTSLPHTCGQLAGGWFVWAFRDAAANAGVFSSPRAARETFSRMAREIKAACASGALTCRPTLNAHIPHMSLAQWLDVPGRMLQALTTSAIATGDSYEMATTRPEPNEALFNLYWSILNYPRTYGPASDRRETLGWIRLPEGEAWPSLTLRDPHGASIRASIQRVASPDLAQATGDEGAANNRFRADYVCPGTCTLEATFADGTQLLLPLGLGGALERAEGGRTLHVDATVAALHPAGLWNRHANTAGKTIQALFRIIPFVFLPLVTLAALAFVWTAVQLARERRLDPVWLCAGSAWVMIGTRLAIVAIVDVSSFPAINPQYTLPATYMLGLAIPLSLSAGWSSWKRSSWKRRNQRPDAPRMEEAPSG